MSTFLNIKRGKNCWASSAEVFSFYLIEMEFLIEIRDLNWLERTADKKLIKRTANKKSSIWWNVTKENTNLVSQSHKLKFYITVNANGSQSNFKWLRDYSARDCIFQQLLLCDYVYPKGFNVRDDFLFQGQVHSFVFPAVLEVIIIEATLKSMCWG